MLLGCSRAIAIGLRSGSWRGRILGSYEVVLVAGAKYRVMVHSPWVVLASNLVAGDGAMGSDAGREEAYCAEG